jgi:hypothetical protein
LKAQQAMQHVHDTLDAKVWVTPEVTEPAQEHRMVKKNFHNALHGKNKPYYDNLLQLVHLSLQ